MKRAAVVASVALLAVGVAGLGPTARSQTPPQPGVVVDQVEICHDPPAPKRQEVSVDSIFRANGHDSHATDIIPPFTHGDGTYPGKNWDPEGQATWFYDCAPSAVPVSDA